MDGSYFGAGGSRSKATTLESNPRGPCEPSQKGLFCGLAAAAQAHVLAPARPKARPSESTISKSPSTRREPLFFTVMRVAAILASRSGRSPPRGPRDAAPARRGTDPRDAATLSAAGATRNPRADHLRVRSELAGRRIGPAARTRTGQAAGERAEPGRSLGPGGQKVFELLALGLVAFVVLAVLSALGVVALVLWLVMLPFRLLGFAFKLLGAPLLLPSCFLGGLVLAPSWASRCCSGCCCRDARRAAGLAIWWLARRGHALHHRPSAMALSPPRPRQPAPCLRSGGRGRATRPLLRGSRRLRYALRMDETTALPPDPTPTPDVQEPEVHPRPGPLRPSPEAARRPEPEAAAPRAPRPPPRPKPEAAVPPEPLRPSRETRDRDRGLRNPTEPVSPDAAACRSGRRRAGPHPEAHAHLARSTPCARARDRSPAHRAPAEGPREFRAFFEHERRLHGLFKELRPLHPADRHRLWSVLTQVGAEARRAQQEEWESRRYQSIEARETVDEKLRAAESLVQDTRGADGPARRIACWARSATCSGAAPRTRRAGC